MFLDLDKKERTRIAAIDDSGEALTYGELCDFAAEFRRYLPERALLFLLSENCHGSLLGYVGCLSNGIVPLILSARTEESFVAISSFAEVYAPPQHCHSGISSREKPSASAHSRAYISRSFALFFKVHPGK